MAQAAYDIKQKLMAALDKGLETFTFVDLIEREIVTEGSSSTWLFKARGRGWVTNSGSRLIKGKYGPRRVKEWTIIRTELRKEAIK